MGKAAKCLSEIEASMLYRIAQNEDVKSSDRPSDRARTRLKYLGLIFFDRDSWLWKLTYAGQDWIAADNAPALPNGEHDCAETK